MEDVLCWFEVIVMPWYVVKVEIEYEVEVEAPNKDAAEEEVWEKMLYDEEFKGRLINEARLYTMETEGECI